MSSTTITEPKHNPDSGVIRATYQLRVDPKQAAGLARRIAYEQTVELPEAIVTDPFVNEHVVGRVEDVCAIDAHRSQVTVAFDAALASGQLSQLLNLVFGNVSIYPGVRLTALELPQPLLDTLVGPRFGIEGLRALLGVYERPLLATAIKPRGLPVSDFADLAFQFASGGGDLVKDDQNLVDDFESFKNRVIQCQQAVDRANQLTGRRCLYFPHVSARFDELPRYLDLVSALGLAGVLICPMIIGLDASRTLLGQYPLVHMAHPAMAGSFMVDEDQGMAPSVLLGQLFRIAGADISIFPNHGGRFSFSQPACQSIAGALKAPLAAMPASFPCPAGGMHYESLPAMAAEYGKDCVWLVGGALFGHSKHLKDGTKAFAQRLLEHFPDARSAPPAAPPSVAQELEALVKYLRFEDADPQTGNHPYEWSDRLSSPYKDADDLAFKGVRRVELFGKFGEPTHYDLRYFEVQPGGHTSREKHVHTHIIIGARGIGKLLLGNENHELRVNDAAYIGPLQVHQLRNEGSEPFGFFCIVDHVRDRPMAP